MMKRFTEIDEEFICENCGRKVEKLEYSCRNHCNHCLYSKHVDKNPGDRAEECHGLLEPIGIEMSSKKGYIIVYKCKKCGAIRKNKAAKDDNFNAILEVSKKTQY
jgi:DNA-directed RNA polymerase subunit RPC12/RpoP